MTLPDEKPSPKEVLEEIKATRTSLDNLPARLDAVERRGNNLLYAVIGTVVVLVVSALAGLWNETRNNNEQNNNFYEFARCQAQYNIANTNATKIRTELTARLNAAQAKRDRKIALLVAGGEGNIQKVFLDYSNELIQIEQARAQNPLPPYPSCYERYVEN